MTMSHVDYLPHTQLFRKTNLPIFIVLTHINTSTECKILKYIDIKLIYDAILLTLLNVMKGKLNDCIRSLLFLLLKIILCVVKYKRPVLVPLNSEPSGPENSIVTLSQNNKILKKYENFHVSLKSLNYYLPFAGMN